VRRRLHAVETDAERSAFPFAAQLALLERERPGRAPEQVILLTSRPREQLAPTAWLQANIDHWSIETGLHARLDASRHDDTCRLRQRNAVWLHGMFTRWANSMFMHWKRSCSSRRHTTTTDFLSAMAADHDRRALSAIITKSFPS
jgi:hypothetical protein